MGLNILIIDDDVEFTRVVKIVLEKKKHQVYVAHSALAGLKLAKDEPIDVILLDILLPEMGGVIVLDLLRKDLPDVAVYIVSGLATTDSRVQLVLKAGPKGYFQKPFPMEELVKTMEGLEKSQLMTSKRRPKNVAIIGLSGAGKTSLMNRFLHNTFTDTSVTLGIDLEFYYEQSSSFKLMDLAGQVAFKELLWEQTLRIADGVIFVCDVSGTEEMHQTAKEWFWQAVDNWTNKNAPVLFLGNKIDLPGKNIYELFNYYELTKLTRSSHSFHILTTSAKTGEGVKSAFDWVFSRVNPNEQKKSSFSSIILLDTAQNIIASHQQTNGVVTGNGESHLDIVQGFLPGTADNMEGVFPFNKEKKQVLVIKKKDGFTLSLVGECSNCDPLWATFDRVLDFAINILSISEELQVRNTQFAWLLQNDFKSLLYDDEQVKIDRKDLTLLVTLWNKSTGPSIINYYPKETQIDVSQIASTCFMSSISIFGHTNEIEPCAVSLPIHYAKREVRIYFDKNTEEEGSSTFALIGIVPRLELLDLFEYDSIVISKRANVQNRDLWTDEVLAGLHEEIFKRALSH